MAFWYKNSNGMGFVPEDGEAEIIEDWELEDVSPGTYESVSDVVTARWSNYRQCLAGAIQNGAVALKLRGEPLPNDAKVELTGITLKRIDCACADGSDTAFYLDVIVIADLEISTPNHAMIMQLIGCRSGQTLTEAMQSAYDYYTDRCRSTEKRKQWFRIRTREDALRFQDDCIGWYPDPEISVYNRKDNLKGIKLTDCLVGVISLEQIEQDAEQRLIQHGMMDSIIEKGFVDMWEYAEKLGAEIRYAKLSLRGRIASKLCLPGKVTRVYEYYGENRPYPCIQNGQLMLEGLDLYSDSGSDTVSLQELKKHRKVSLKFDKPTILIDPMVCDTESKEQNGISHECFHIEIHARFLLLQNHQRTRFTALNMTGEDYDSYEEEREYYAELAASGGQSSRSSERDEIDWVEWQARMGTVRRRMPRSLVRKKVQELYKRCRRENRMMSEKDITALVINDLALTFHVSKEMAKIRMIEVGYEDARGAMVFVDGKYAPAHQTSTGVHPRNISYVISTIDAARLYAEDEQFNRVLNSGKFVFVDNFFCIDSSEYIEIRDGEKHLTSTALSQIDKCCLSFRIEYKSKTSYFDKTGLHSDSDIGDPIAAALSNIPIEMLIESQADIEERCAGLPASYGETLVFHREKKGMSQDDLAWALGIKPDTLRDYEHSLLFEPSRIFFASVGRILKLPGYYTKDMMNKANCSLEFSRDQMKHLDFIVTFMYMRSLEDCNAMAAHFHLPPLLGRSDEEIAQGRKLRNGKITRKRDSRIQSQRM